jgi:hypothetical protein
LQPVSKRFNCAFITQTVRGSKFLQPIWVGDALPDCGYNAGGTRFVENNSVATVFDDPATKSRCNDGASGALALLAE